ERLGRRAVGLELLAPVTVTDRAEEAGPERGLAQPGLEEMAGRGLAVRPGDADHRHPLVRTAVVVARRERQPEAVVRHLHPGGACRARVGRARGQMRRRAALESLVEVRKAVIPLTL